MSEAPVVEVSPGALADDFVAVFDELKSRGDLVWVDTGSRRFLLVNSPDFVRELLVERAADLAKPSSQTLETGKAEATPGAEGIPVAEFRAALTKGMGAGRVPEVLLAVAGAASAEVERWTDGMQLRLIETLRRIAIATVCHGAFGTHLDLDETTRAERALNDLERGVRVKTKRTLLVHRLKGDELRRRVAYEELARIADRLIANADLSAPTELTAVVQDLPALAPALSAQQIRGLLVELFMGAVEPLTQTSSWMLVRFVEETQAAERLRDEWAEVFTAGYAVDKTTLAASPQTAAFVREVTRLHPTNERITREAIADTSVGGERVPALTRVILNVNALHRDPRSFAEPDRFWPERWLEGRPTEHKLAYVAFGVGGRRCLGETIALVTLTALLPTLARDWDFELGELRIASGGRRQPADTTTVTLRRRP
jgi:cytochrome P450